MKFAPSAEQNQFADSLHDLLRGADTPATVRAWAEANHEPGRKLWHGLAELGVAGLLVPESHGGLGAEPADMVVAFEALGYHAVPGPLVETAAVVPMLLAGELAEQWLPQLATGEVLATVLAPPHVPLALDADVAALILQVSGDEIEEVSGQFELVRSVDPARRLFRMESSPDVSDSVHRGFDFGVLAVAAQLLGAGRRLLDDATHYAKQRHQYGKPIGQYQAIKHLLADVVTQLELARPLAYGAAVTGSVQDISAAKVAAGTAAYLAARTALQVHGAVGYTAEHDLSLWLTKVRALTGAWGGPSFHRKRLLAALDSKGHSVGPH